MDIKILEFVEGARNAKGVTVIIDVFRAFSVACYAIDAGASMLIATAEVEEAFNLKTKYKNALLVGERDEKRIEGFDFGNSPTEIIKADIIGKTIIHTTTAGTNGLSNALNSDITITGSLVNVNAIIKYINALNPDHVSLVAMGYKGYISADEDLLCAEIIKNGLEGKVLDYKDRISALRYSSGKRFFDSANIYFSPPTDFFLCTMIDRFNFVLKSNRRLDGNTDLARIDL